MTGPILVLNGPNLNMLGIREPDVYGSQTLDDIVELCRETAARHDRIVDAFQSNSEGAMIDRIHSAHGFVSAVVINPGGWTHTSVALRDALSVLTVPIVEVHLSNVFARETFRHHSYVSPVARAVISGLGAAGYVVAIDYLCAENAA